MALKQPKTDTNGHLPTAKDFVNPKNISKAEKESLDAFREAMKALKEEEAKYGKKTDF
jgi:hypothetical protein